MSKTIPVVVNGKTYGTQIVQGVQRFKVNRLLRHIVGSNTQDLMNQLCVAYQAGHFRKSEYIDFYTGIGYSVCGLQEVFPGLRINNPLWK